MNPAEPSGATIFGRIILLIGGLCLSILAMVVAAMLWGSADGIAVFMLGCLVVGLIAGPLYKRHLDRQDRA